MTVTFFEKWLEEKKSDGKVPDPWGSKYPGEGSEKYKKAKAKVDAQEAPKIAKRQAKKNKTQSELAKRIENSPAIKKTGKGQEIDGNNPASETSSTEKPTITKKESQKDRELDIKQQEADRKDRVAAERAKQYADRVKRAEDNKKLSKKQREDDQAVAKEKQLKDDRKERTSKIKFEKTKRGDDSLKAGGVAAANLVKSVRKISSSTGLTDAGDRLKDKIKSKAASAIKTGASKGASAVSSAAQKTGSAVKQGASSVKQGAGHAAKRIQAIKRTRNINQIRRNKPGALVRTNTDAVANTNTSALVKRNKPATPADKFMSKGRRPGSGPLRKPINQNPMGASKPGASLGQQARNNPRLKAKLINMRNEFEWELDEGLRTAVKNVIKKVKAYQKKRKSIVKRDPDATAVATTKGSKMTKYEKQPSSVSKAGSSAVTSTAKKEVAQKKGKETEGQKARRDPEYRKKKIEQDVAAARKWVGRRKAVKAVQSVTQKAKDTATSAKEAGGKLVKSVASGKLARQIKTGAYKAKKVATETGKKVAKATLEKDPTAKAGASARRTVHKVGQKFRRAMSAADRLHRMEKKGLQPGKGKPKSDGKVPDPWNEEYAIDEGIMTNIESWKKKKKRKRKSKKVKFPKATSKDNTLTAVGKVSTSLANRVASNWREEFLHEVEQPEMGETDQKEPDSKSKSKKGDSDEKKIDVMKGKNKVEVNPQLKAESINHPIDAEKHKKAQKVAKIRNLAKGNKNPNEKEAAEKKAGGPKLYGEDFVTERAKSGELNKRPKGAIARARAAQGLSADDRVTDTKYRKLGKVTKKVSRSSKDWRTTDVVEEAPPGREKQVKALKKKFPNDPEAPYKIAWAQHNKESVMIQDANGNDFLEVIDVIKAEPLVPVKEGRINGNGKQEKFNRAMNAYRKAQRAGNLSNKERVDRLKDNAKIRREAEKKEKKGKQFAGGQVYNEDKKSKLVSIVKAAANEKKRKNALQIQKYVGEETPDAISGKDLKRISFLSGKRTRFGPEETAKRKAALAKKHGGEENIKDHPQFKS